MDRLSPQEIEILILGYEELEGEEKQTADAYLARDAELAERLRWHQETEMQSRAPLPIVDADGTADDLDAASEREQAESLRRILAELESVAPGSPVLSLVARLRRPALWVLPLAALLSLAILLPRDRESKALLYDLNAARFEVLSDGTRGPDRSVSDAGVLHTGETFALEFHLESDAYVVVYHLDPAGRVSRVFPAPLTADTSLLDGGRKHRIPDRESDEIWVLGSDTGTESFLVTSSIEWPADLESVRADESITERAAILADLRAQLEERADRVDLYEFQHLD